MQQTPPNQDKADHTPDATGRRTFLAKGLLGTLALALGGSAVNLKSLQAAAQSGSLKPAAFSMQGKHPDLVVLSDRPWNVETPPHLLDDRVTPTDRVFIRNNGLPPGKVDAASWTLTIEGESARTKKVFTLAELQSKFKHYTYQLQLECGGNGRAEFSPPGKGNQWGNGAVYCSEWTGVRVKDVLEAAGIKPDAVYVAYYGKDVHLSGDTSKVPISRGVPIKKALEDESLIAWAINGKAIPEMHGYPLRVVFGGWPASASGKWVDRIVVRNKVHDGPKMNKGSYMVPARPIPPGAPAPDDKDMRIIESMPVRSLITYPKTGAIVKGKKTLQVRGHAWAGDLEVKEIHVSTDFGATWQKCELEKPVNRLAWQHWKTQVKFPSTGYFEVWARATDTAGASQPMVVPAWNPGGYLNNACHRIAIQIA
ncbi:sulfite oxidase [Pontibacter sp. E15-1]|uniref:sulfite oxidase n=1 Tax=Pontibacter sp. E15-1 TaxID=2919918 RepID=UPI001F4F42F9|nr:sulfite oxidase [Pontibacter sp. E15-1]MCJ8164323.1 sulfite oxidase [Pontibacter sp. E15-1]